MPSNYPGLRIQLSPGWYALAPYMSDAQLRRLVELLLAGVEDIDELVELDWETLDQDRGDQKLDKSLVVLRVPPGRSDDGEALRKARAKLGSVRLGLLRDEAPERWADVAWQERQVKVPLLRWLKRTLRSPGHPLAEFGVAKLPLDMLASLTADPVELLEMCEATLEHRLRHGPREVEPERWNYSAARAAADRLADRLLDIPEGLRRRALDLAMSGKDRVVIASLEDREASRALTLVGLAWHEGNDVLLSPLARSASSPVGVRRLIERIPEPAWSDASKSVLRKAMPAFTPVPRACLVVPEPRYWRWPALTPKVGRVLAGLEDPELEAQLGPELRTIQTALAHGEDLELFLEEDDEVESSPVTALVSGLLNKLFDEELTPADFEGGQLRHFATVDQELLARPGGRELCALLRWMGVSLQLRRIDSRALREFLITEVELARKFACEDSELDLALRFLLGDLSALNQDYRGALSHWKVSEQPDIDERVLHRIYPRRVLALFRVDAVVEAQRAFLAFLDLEPSFDEDEDESDATDEFIAWQLSNELIELTWRLSSRPTGKASSPFTPESDWLIDHQAIRLTRVAVALELGDWPHAIRLAQTLNADRDGPVAARAQLLWAWVKATLGDISTANDILNSVFECARQQGDRLLEALCLRGGSLLHLILAKDDGPAFELLDQARALEAELELPDAKLLDLELTGWRALSGQATRADYEAKIAAVHEAQFSDSLAAAVIGTQLRLLSASLHFLRHDEELLSNPDFPVSELVESLPRDSWLVHVSPWTEHASEQLLECGLEFDEHGQSQAADELFASVRKLAEGNERLLERYEEQHARLLRRRAKRAELDGSPSRR